MKWLVTIQENEIGLLKKKLSLNAKRIPIDQFVALKGEAGWQADVLGPGRHVINPMIYEVIKVPLVEIPAGEIGLVIANDGAELEMGQVLAHFTECRKFQDARLFLENGDKKESN